MKKYNFKRKQFFLNDFLRIDVMNKSKLPRGRITTRETFKNQKMYFKNTLYEEV